MVSTFPLRDDRHAFQNFVRPAQQLANSSLRMELRAKVFLQLHALNDLSRMTQEGYSRNEPRAVTDACSQIIRIWAPCFRKYAATASSKGPVPATITRLP